MTETEILAKLVETYRQMHEHTWSECKETCTRIGSCCDLSTCEQTFLHASQHWDVALQPTGNPRLPLMGPEGCIAEPHHRQLCTVHHCGIASIGQKKGPGGDAWTTRYFELRYQLEELEALLGTTEAVRWEPGECSTQTRQLSGGFVITLGHSDANYPPGQGEGKLNLNTMALWLKVDVEDHEAIGYPFPLGWWAVCQSTRSMHQAKGMIDQNGYTLPAELAADYWQARVFQLETRLKEQSDG